MAKTELDYMEYANDAAAQAAYVSSNIGPIITTQQLSEGGNLGWAINSERIAMGFKVSTTDAITKFIVKIKTAIGATTGTITGYIFSDTGANLPNAALATFSNMDVADLTSSYVEYEFTGTFVPAANTQYHIVLVWTNATVKDLVASMVTSDQYANGRISRAALAGAWQHVSDYDLYFKVYQNVPAIQCYSESTLKMQGSYSLKGIAKITAALNETLTRTVAPTIDLSGGQSIKNYGRALRTGTNIQIQIHDSGGTTSTKNIVIAQANTWEQTTWDISGIADADKDAIDQIVIKVTNADAANTFYLDDMFAEITANFPVARLRKDVIHGYNCFIKQYVTASREGLTPLKLPDGTVF